MHLKERQYNHFHAMPYLICIIENVIYVCTFAEYEFELGQSENESGQLTQMDLLKIIKIN